jgi:hypothetical protein
MNKTIKAAVIAFAAIGAAAVASASFLIIRDVTTPIEHVQDAPQQAAPQLTAEQLASLPGNGPCGSPGDEKKAKCAADPSVAASATAPTGTEYVAPKAKADVAAAPAQKSNDAAVAASDVKTPEATPEEADSDRMAKHPLSCHNVTMGYVDCIVTIGEWGNFPAWCEKDTTGKIYHCMIPNDPDTGKKVDWTPNDVYADQ